MVRFENAALPDAFLRSRPARRDRACARCFAAGLRDFVRNIDSSHRHTPSIGANWKRRSLVRLQVACGVERDYPLRAQVHENPDGVLRGVAARGRHPRWRLSIAPWHAGDSNRDLGISKTWTQ